MRLDHGIVLPRAEACNKEYTYVGLDESSCILQPTRPNDTVNGWKIACHSNIIVRHGTSIERGPPNYSTNDSHIYLF